MRVLAVSLAMMLTCAYGADSPEVPIRPSVNKTTPEQNNSESDKHKNEACVAQNAFIVGGEKDSGEKDEKARDQVNDVRDSWISHFLHFTLTDILIACFTGALCIYAAGQLGSLRAGANAAKAAAEIARSTLIASYRPWLKLIVEQDGPVHVGGENINIRLKVRIINIGSAPAFNVQVLGSFVTGKDLEKTGSVEQVFKVSHQGFVASIMDGNGGAILYPSDFAHKINFGLGAPQEAPLNNTMLVVGASYSHAPMEGEKIVRHCATAYFMTDCRADKSGTEIPEGKISFGVAQSFAD